MAEELVAEELISKGAEFGPLPSAGTEPCCLPEAFGDSVTSEAPSSDTVLAGTDEVNAKVVGISVPTG